MKKTVKAPEINTYQAYFFRGRAVAQVMIDELEANGIKTTVRHLGMEIYKVDFDCDALKKMIEG